MSLSSTQLDPQTLQGKDWQRTVIPMNGVSRSLLYFYQSAFSIYVLLIFERLTNLVIVIYCMCRCYVAPVQLHTYITVAYSSEDCSKQFLQDVVQQLISL